jgi:hypothetical protein
MDTSHENTDFEKAYFRLFDLQKYIFSYYM